MKMENNIVYQEDCIEGMRKIPSNSIDLVLTDPPYNITNRNEWDKPIDLENFWVEIKRVLKENGCVIVTASQPFTTDLINSNREMFKYCLYWNKLCPTGFLNSKKQPLRVIEDICVFYIKPPIYNPQMQKTGKVRKKGGGKVATLNYGKFKNGYFSEDDLKYPKNLLEFSNANKSIIQHPTQKPVELFKWLIKSYSNENQLVLDCFAGSGTTAIACIETNRKYICFENNPQYFKIINDRIQSAKSQTQLSNESCPTEDLIGIKRKPCEVSQSLLRKPSLNSDIKLNKVSHLHAGCNITR